MAQEELIPAAINWSLRSRISILFCTSRHHKRTSNRAYRPFQSLYRLVTATGRDRRCRMEAVCDSESLISNIVYNTSWSKRAKSEKACECEMRSPELQIQILFIIPIIHTSTNRISFSTIDHAVPCYTINSLLPCTARVLSINQAINKCTSSLIIFSTCQSNPHAAT